MYSGLSYKAMFIHGFFRTAIMAIPGCTGRPVKPSRWEKDLHLRLEAMADSLTIRLKFGKVPASYCRISACTTLLPGCKVIFTAAI
jgi:hypothetical protein